MEHPLPQMTRVEQQMQRGNSSTHQIYLADQGTLSKGTWSENKEKAK
jgi:hypothetical protein